MHSVLERMPLGENLLQGQPDSGGTALEGECHGRVPSVGGWGDQTTAEARKGRREEREERGGEKEGSWLSHVFLPLRLLHLLEVLLKFRKCLMSKRGMPVKLARGLGLALCDVGRERDGI